MYITVLSSSTWYNACVENIRIHFFAYFTFPINKKYPLVICPSFPPWFAGESQDWNLTISDLEYVTSDGHSDIMVLQLHMHNKMFSQSVYRYPWYHRAQAGFSISYLTWLRLVRYEFRNLV